MPIPAIIAAVAIGGAGVLGVGGHLSAKETNEKAQDISRNAQNTYDAAVESLEEAKNNTEQALLKLGYAKKDVLSGSVKRFLQAYDRVKDVQMGQSIGLDEISNFSIEYEDTVQLQEMSDIYSTSIQSGVAGVATGAVIALAASGTLPVVTSTLSLAGSVLALGEVGTAASIAGSALSLGASMTPLAAVAAPVVLFTGISASMKADENLEKAQEMEAEVEEAVEEMKVSETLCKSIAKRSGMFEELLVKLDSMFSECTDMLDAVTQGIVSRLGNRTITAENLTQNELELIAVTRALAGAVKSVIDTPILTKNGNLTRKSLDLYNQTTKSLPDFNESVEKVKSYDYTVKVVENIPSNIYVSPIKVKQVNEKAEGKNEGVFMSILAVLFGIISIITLGVFIFPEILGIVFACHGKKQGKMRAGAIAGLICSIVSIFILILLILIIVLV